MKTMNASGASVKADADRLADFVLFTQRSCILNLSSELNKGNVSFPQFFLLTYLSSEEYLTMSDIAKKMGHSTAAATGLVDRLEKLSYVERMHAAEDRRKIMVRITAKGIELVAKMRNEIANDLAGILAGMDEDQAEAVEHTKRAIHGRAIA
jgi:DNA-binding MarR family transcriptional regulator